MARAFVVPAASLSSLNFALAIYGQRALGITRQDFLPTTANPSRRGSFSKAQADSQLTDNSILTMPLTLPTIVELSRQPAPAVAPQALAWHGDTLWIGSRDARRLYGVNPQTWAVVEEAATPGIPWGAVAAHDALYVASGEDADDDRYLRRYQPGRGFDGSYRVAAPEFTGSYLSFDGQNLYLSQWYKHRVLQLDPNAQVLRTIEIGAEICGHVFVDAHLYVLRGTEQDGENWHVARLDLRETTPRIEELARVGFACRSLTFDGERFWSNHRAENQTVSFTLPKL